MTNNQCIYERFIATSKLSSLTKINRQQQSEDQAADRESERLMVMINNIVRIIANFLKPSMTNFFTIIISQSSSLLLAPQQELEVSQWKSMYPIPVRYRVINFYQFDRESIEKKGSLDSEAQSLMVVLNKDLKMEIIEFVGRKIYSGNRNFTFTKQLSPR